MRLRTRTKELRLTRSGGDVDPGRRSLVPWLHPRWLPHRWIVQLTVVALCALAAIVWSSSPRSAAPDSLVAGVNTSTVAGEPSSSIIDATEAATAGELVVDGDRGQATSDVADTSESSQATVVGGGGDGDSDGGSDRGGSSGTDDSSTGDNTAGDIGTPGGGAAAADETGDDPAAAVPAAPIIRPTRTFPVNQTDRLTTAGLVTMVENNQITTVADFLSALPRYMGESYTLMEDSRSRHRASTEYPRLIMYGPDARMLIGVSSHPLDPLREVVELAELDDTTGLWRFSQFDFRNAFVHDTNTESCAGCHGSPQRPIWGEYPDWPGAFAGRDERLAGGQAATLMNLKADPLDRFHQLAFPSDHSIQNNGQFYLPTREYGYANTSFNFELNAAVADGIARRIVTHPSWGTDGYRLLASQWDCGRRNDSASIDALYNLFGIDGNNDFQLESPVFEAKDDQRNEYDWNQGSTGLDDSVAFRTLDLAADLDPELGAVVNANQLFVDFSNYWFNILGAERAEFVRNYGIYEIDFRPQNLGGGFVGQVCNYLATNGG